MAQLTTCDCCTSVIENCKTASKIEFYKEPKNDQKEDMPVHPMEYLMERAKNKDKADRSYTMCKSCFNDFVEMSALFTLDRRESGQMLESVLRGV